MARRSLVRPLAAAVALVAATTPFALAGGGAPDAGAVAAKVSPPLRHVATHGYGGLDIAAIVPGHVPGHVYYLAEVGAIDDGLRAALAGAGAIVRHEFPEIGWVALAGTGATVDGVAGLDRVRRLRLDEVRELLQVDVRYTNALPAADQGRRGTGDIRAPQLWSRGVTGKGVVVGVADSGVDQLHPDLDGDKFASFANCLTVLPTVLAEPDSVGECLPSPGIDDNGHGTHVAGIAAGSGEGAVVNGKAQYPGVAPGASVAGTKVCNAGGSCLTSSTMAGYRYLATDLSEGGAGADVVNVSLGGGRAYGAGVFGAEQVTNDDPGAQLVNALAEKYNVVFTISAGNSGPSLQTVGSPSVASQAISVGAAVTDFDLAHPVDETLHGEFGNVRPAAPKAGATVIAGFSSRGSTGDRLIKPELTAPGSYYVAAESTAGEIAVADIAHDNKFSGDKLYAVVSGTSMSAPAAAGAAALLIDGFRQATGASPRYWEVKAALANTAGTHAFEGPVTGLINTIRLKVTGEAPEDLYPTRNEAWVGVTGEGAGRIDVVNALAALTSGVVVYIPRGEKLDDIHDQQPNWALNDLGTGDQVSQGFVLDPGPRMAAPAKTTFAVEPGREPAGIHAIPKEWVLLPGATTVSPGANTPFTLGLRIPQGAAPGQYAGTVVASVRLTPDVVQHVRIPVQFFVRLDDPNPARGGVAVEGPIWASETTDYSYVGFQHPLGDIHTDWIPFPVHVPAGTTRIDLKVWDADGRDHMDVFAFTHTGDEIDSTVSADPDHWIPGGQTWYRTSKDLPAEVTLLDADDWEEIEAPTTIWLMVSDSRLDDGPGFGRFHLEVDLIRG